MYVCVSFFSSVCVCSFAVKFDRYEHTLDREDRRLDKCLMPNPDHCGRSPATMTLDYLSVLEHSYMSVLVLALTICVGGVVSAVGGVSGRACFCRDGCGRLGKSMARCCRYSYCFARHLFAARANVSRFLHQESCMPLPAPPSLLVEARDA